MIIRTVDQRPYVRRLHHRPYATGRAGRADLVHGGDRQAQAEATKEAQKAGIEHAKDREGAYRGRKPSYTRTQLEAVRDILAQGTSISSISKTTGLSRQSIYRIQNTPADAEAALARWTA